MIQKELTLILTDYRRHLNVRSPFELSFLDDYGYDGDIHDNIHDVKFWGRGVGRDCERENSPCLVWYNHAFYERVPRPTVRLAKVVAPDDHALFDVTYATRNRVLSDSGHPVPVPDERWTSLTLKIESLLVIILALQSDVKIYDDDYGCTRYVLGVGYMYEHELEFIIST
ncbi:hypothetical protein GGU10DRAFT_362360 [Lentinula aff. detonsa]|uniref:Uncharacterized protein n=1 Tax=Lentinula aff. detonsa TaxID=2804958 RepID=A0AA38K8W1_9AGAR|nr:hypothetical protein GGU10DRAFT_362360 [Lentinula aff. detonsa]